MCEPSVARPPDFADLPDVPCGSWVLCDRRPPSADGYNNSKASLTFLLETFSR